MSNRAKFWIGVVLAGPAVVALAMVAGVGSSLVSSITNSGNVFAFTQLGFWLVSLGGWIALVVIERTRWLALGMLAGLAILAVVVAGACVALLAAYQNGA
jgi:hypothetical protein